MKSSHVSLPRPCFWCRMVGWWKSIGGRHVICPACKGGGARAIPIPRKKWEAQMDKIIQSIQESE